MSASTSAYFGIPAPLLIFELPQKFGPSAVELRGPAQCQPWPGTFSPHIGPGGAVTGTLVASGLAASANVPGLKLIREFADRVLQQLRRLLWLGLMRKSQTAGSAGKYYQSDH
jgi:hypothetical protein